MNGNMTETDKIKEHLVALTRDLVLIPGTSLRPDDLERCFEFVKDCISRTDRLEISEYRHNGIPSLVALPEGIRAPDVLLISHLDVINHNDVRAYNPVVENGKIFGAGCGDMKGQLAIMLHLFSNFHSKYPEASLGIAVTSDEEQGGTSGIGYLFDEIGLKCGLAINPDGGGLHEITIAEKGVIHLHISYEGHASHAARPWLGENSVELIMEKVLLLKQYFNSLRKVESKWYPTCTLTIINTPNKTTNRIPSMAEGNLDIRFPSPYTVDQILAETANILGERIKKEVILSAEPLELEPDYLFKSAIEEITGTEATFVREDGASDARFIQNYGIPVIISRPVVGNIHAEDEWIDIESMLTFYRICELFLEKKLLNSEKGR